MSFLNRSAQNRRSHIVLLPLTWHSLFFTAFYQLNDAIFNLLALTWCPRMSQKSFTPILTMALRWININSRKSLKLWRDGKCWKFPCLALCDAGCKCIRSCHSNAICFLKRLEPFAQSYDCGREKRRKTFVIRQILLFIYIKLCCM